MEGEGGGDGVARHDEEGGGRVAWRANVQRGRGGEAMETTVASATALWATSDWLVRATRRRAASEGSGGSGEGRVVKAASKAWSRV